MFLRTLHTLEFIRWMLPQFKSILVRGHGQKKKKKTYFSINITFFIPENEIFNSVKVFLKFYLYIYLLKKVWGLQVLRSASTGGATVYWDAFEFDQMMTSFHRRRRLISLRWSVFVIDLFCCCCFFRWSLLIWIFLWLFYFSHQHW